MWDLGGSRGRRAQEFGSGQGKRDSRGASVTPSVLPHKTTYKTIHKHHIYLILHVIYCVDKVL
jgi:hypothetical protein